MFDFFGASAKDLAFLDGENSFCNAKATILGPPVVEHRHVQPRRRPRRAVGLGARRRVAPTSPALFPPAHHAEQDLDGRPRETPPRGRSAPRGACPFSTPSVRRFDSSGGGLRRSTSARKGAATASAPPRPRRRTRYH